MSTAKKIVIGSALVIGGGFGLSKLLSLKGKADAGSNLKLTLKSFKLLGASVRQGISFKVLLNAHNNSSQLLKFSQPFVELSILGADNKLQPIAFSNTATGEVELKPRSTSELGFDLFIPPLQALKLPGLLFYLVSRFSGVEPKSTKKVVIEYGLNAEGVEINSKSDVPI